MTILFHGSDHLFDEIDPGRLQYVVTSGSIRHSGWGFFTSTAPETARQFLRHDGSKPGAFALYRYDIDDKKFADHLIVDDRPIGETHFRNILKTALDHKNKSIFAHLKDITPTTPGEYLLAIQQGQIKNVRAREATEMLAKAGIHYFYMSRENCIIVLEPDVLPEATLVELRENPQIAYIERGSALEKLISLGPATANMVAVSEVLPVAQRKQFLDTANRLVNEITARDAHYDPHQDIHPIKRLNFYMKDMDPAPGLSEAVYGFAKELSLIWPNLPVYPAKVVPMTESGSITRISAVQMRSSGVI